MSFAYMTENKADIIGKGVFLIGLGILFLTNNWWPGILLVILVAYSIRHYLLKRYWEMAMLMAIFLFIFVISYYHIEVMYIVPALLILSGLYFILKEYFAKDQSPINELGPSSRSNEFDQGNGDA